MLESHYKFQQIRCLMGFNKIKKSNFPRASGYLFIAINEAFDIHKNSFENTWQLSDKKSVEVKNPK